MGGIFAGAREQDRPIGEPRFARFAGLGGSLQYNLFGFREAAIKISGSFSLRTLRINRRGSLLRRKPQHVIIIKVGKAKLHYQGIYVLK